MLIKFKIAKINNVLFLSLSYSLAISLERERGIKPEIYSNKRIFQHYPSNILFLPLYLLPHPSLLLLLLFPYDRLSLSLFLSPKLFSRTFSRFPSPRENHLSQSPCSTPNLRR